MRLTVDEYAKHFRMSKEMINAKLRTKKLNYIIENGIVYIIVPKAALDDKKHEAITQERSQQQEVHKTEHKNVTKSKTTVAMVIALYQKENQQLKEKIAQLEAKIDKLIDDKEQMLRDEMSKIEQVYAKKDEQLKNILELMNRQMLTQSAMQREAELVSDSIETQTVEESSQEKADEIVELKSFLKTLDLEPHQRKIIKKRFLAVYDSDVRIIKKNGKLYLNFSKYDYSDLLEY